VELVATEGLVLLVVWLAGWVWRVEAQHVKIFAAIVTGLVIGSMLAWIAAFPSGRDEPALELICGGAVGLLVMMLSHLRGAGQR
jgi:hypothetical protein